MSDQLAELADKMHVLKELDSINVENLATGVRGPVSVAVDRVENALLLISSAQRVVVEHRLLAEPKATLAEVGALLGVTRERTRQLQANLEARIAQALGSEMPLVASVLPRGARSNCCRTGI